MANQLAWQDRHANTGLNEAGISMLAEYWYWIFGDPVTGHRRSTGSRRTPVEGRGYSQAQPVQGTLQLRDSKTDFEDTIPLVFHNERSQ